MIKPFNIRVSTLEVTPKIYTIIFLIDNKYHKHQCVAVNFESAIQKAYLIPKANINNVWWWFTIDFNTVKAQLKNIK